jgi:hypothetical protein
MELKLLKTTSKNTNGFNYYEELGISVEFVVMIHKEIINQCIKNKEKISIST